MARPQPSFDSEPATGVRPVEHAVMKTCACGARYTHETWRRLRLCGYIDKGKQIAGELLELRLCAACGSSIAFDLGEEPDSIAKIPVAPRTR